MGTSMMRTISVLLFLGLLFCHLGPALAEQSQTQAIEALVKSCPLVGIVDNPPPAALNGGTPGSNQSSLAFSYVDRTTTSLKIDWKVGLFVTTGSMAPVYADVHAGTQGSFSESETIYTRIDYVFQPNYEAGKVAALHAVPVTKARKFETYRNNTSDTRSRLVGVATEFALQGTLRIR